MIYVNSTLKIVDNSGGLLIYCIKIYKKKKIKTEGKIGDLIIGSLKKTSTKKDKVKTSQLIKAIIVRQKKKIKIIDNFNFFFSDSGVILLNSKMQPLGNRIYGPIPKILTKCKFTKINSLAYATI